MLPFIIDKTGDMMEVIKVLKVLMIYVGAGLATGSVTQALGIALIGMAFIL